MEVMALNLALVVAAGAEVVQGLLAGIAQVVQPQMAAQALQPQSLDRKRTTLVGVAAALMARKVQAVLEAALMGELQRQEQLIPEVEVQGQQAL